jgi:hypothetical protein
VLLLLLLCCCLCQSLCYCCSLCCCCCCCCCYCCFIAAYVTPCVTAAPCAAPYAAAVLPDIFVAAYTHEHLHARMYLCTYKHIPQIRNVCLNMHAYSHKRSHTHTHPSHAPTPAQLLPLYLMRLVPPANACAGETLITLPASATPFPSISSHPATLHKPSRRQVLRRAIQVSPSHLQVCVAWCSARWT